MKIGPAVLQNVSSREASALVSLFSKYNSDVIFAPVGYPEIHPKARAKALEPGRLNRGLMIGTRIILISSTKGVTLSKFIQIKNGNNDGITLFAHNLIELCVISYVLLEKQIVQIKMDNSKMTKKYFLKYIKIITFIKGM